MSVRLGSPVRRCYVYRAYSADGSLLYIGSTVQPGIRMTEHVVYSWWWRVAKRITFELFPDEAEGRAAESAAILAEYPRWNVRGRSRSHPDGRARSIWEIRERFPADCTT